MVRRSEETLLGPDRGGRRAQARIRQPDHTRAVVLVMHGGKVASDEGARWSQPSVARMEPFAESIWRDGHTRGVAVWSLLFARRGWNDVGAPLEDARWALAQIRERYGDVPVVLLGHSLGGRTAVRVAGDESVIGVVGLAPWLPAEEPGAQLAGRALTIIHGTADVWVPITLSRAFVARHGTVPRRLEFTPVHGSGHTMLLRAGRWHALAADAVARMLREHAECQDAHQCR